MNGINYKKESPAKSLNLTPAEQDVSIQKKCTAPASVYCTAKCLSKRSLSSAQKQETALENNSCFILRRQIRKMPLLMNKSAPILTNNDAFSFNVSNEEDGTHNKIYEGKKIIISNGKIYYINFIDKRYTILSDGSIFFDSDGYCRLKIDKSPNHLGTGEFTLICGGFFAEAFSYFSAGAKYNNSSTERNCRFEILCGRILSAKRDSEYISNRLIDFSVRNLTARYVVDEKYNTIYKRQTCVPRTLTEKNNGAFSSAEIELLIGVKELNLVCGCVDLNNPASFKENNRPKLITVVDIKNNTQFDIHIEDRVCFTRIKFNERTDRIKLIVKEIYPGTKYDASYISAITDRLNDELDKKSIQRTLRNVLKNYKKF